MPELPEVETIRRGLEKHIIGYTIDAIEIRLAKQFHGDPQLVIGAKIIAVRRYGKGLLIDLDNGYSLAIHVKMTGQLLFVKQVTDSLPSKHTHVVFSLSRHPELVSGSQGPSNGMSLRLQMLKQVQHDDTAYLFYNDQRQFGWIKVVKTDEAAAMPFFKSLGPEPLSNLTIQQFNSIVKKYKTPIKLLIMDQSKIAGIGNIYANDALYRARIHPKRPANSLSTNERKALFNAIEEVLKKGIEVGGASEWHYVDVLGSKGQYQNFFLVYRKDGKSCPQCGAIIERMILGGRGTFYCPNCQK